MAEPSGPAIVPETRLLHSSCTTRVWWIPAGAVGSSEREPDSIRAALSWRTVATAHGAQICDLRERAAKEAQEGARRRSDIPLRSDKVESRLQIQFLKKASSLPSHQRRGSSCPAVSVCLGTGVSGVHVPLRHVSPRAILLHSRSVNAQTSMWQGVNENARGGI